MTCVEKEIFHFHKKLNAYKDVKSWLRHSFNLHELIKWRNKIMICVTLTVIVLKFTKKRLVTPELV